MSLGTPNPSISHVFYGKAQLPNIPNLNILFARYWKIYNKNTPKVIKSLLGTIFYYIFKNKYALSFNKK